MAYNTLELKTNDEGGTAVETVYSGKDLRMAEKKFYDVLSTAATSGRICHAAVILDSEGMIVAQRAYVNEQEAE